LRAAPDDFRGAKADLDSAAHLSPQSPSSIIAPGGNGKSALTVPDNTAQAPCQRAAAVTQQWQTLRVTDRNGDDLVVLIRPGNIH
jgi:hypothetical protein